MNFASVMSWSALQTITRLGLGLISMKLTAVTFGSEGVGLMAQIGTFISLASGLFSSGASMAIVRLYHDVKTIPSRLTGLINNSIWIAIACALCMLVLILASNPLSQFLFGSPHYTLAVVVALACIPLTVAGTLLQAWLNAKEQIKSLYIGQIVVNIAGFIVVYMAITSKALNITLIGIAVSYALPAIYFGLLIALRSDRKPSEFKPPSGISQLVKFYPMLIVHAIAMPATLLLVRWSMTEREGIDAMGGWQAGWRLSEIYMGVITTAASTYFAPKLAAVVDDFAEFRKVALQLFASVLIPVVCTAIFLMVCRSWVIPLIFSNTFVLTEQMLPMQLLGDLPRALHWCTGLLLVTLIARTSYIGLELLGIGLVAIFTVGLQEQVTNVIGTAFFLSYLVSGTIGLVYIYRKVLRQPR